MDATPPSGLGAVKQGVKEYYGTDLSKTTDLKTSACMVAGEVPADVMKLLRNVHPEVRYLRASSRLSRLGLLFMTNSRG